LCLTAFVLSAALTQQVEDLRSINTLSKGILHGFDGFEALLDKLHDELEAPEPAETGLTGSAPFSSDAFQGFNHIYVLFQTEHAKFKAE
jgi:hypothetical protein